MQIISSYLYSNRIQLIADVTELDLKYPVEWKIVYQRPVKIYKGVDNLIELDVKNSDQKRINIHGKDIKIQLMDQANKSIQVYTAMVLDDGSTVASRGRANFTIPESDVSTLDAQSLKFSVYILNDDDSKTLLYGDSKFGALGIMQLEDSIMPYVRPVQRYEDFQPETNYQGKTIEERISTFYSSAITTKFYEAVPTQFMTVKVYVTGFSGRVSIQGTKKITIGHEAFLNPAYQSTQIITAEEKDSDTIELTFVIDITDLTYLRVSYIKETGSVDYFTVSS